MKKTLAVLLLLAPFASAQVVVNPGGGGSATSSGSTISGCTSSILYADASSLLKCDPAAVVNGSVSTAGRSILTIQDTISGSSASSNFLSINGTFPTPTAETSGVLYSFTPVDDADAQNGLKVRLLGSTGTTGLTKRGIFGDLTGAGAAILGQSVTGTGSVDGIGVWGDVTGGYASYGVVGVARSGTQIGGVFGMADSDIAWSNGVIAVLGPTPMNLGAEYVFNETAALLATNLTAAKPIAAFMDNTSATSTTAASANITILDGAQMRLGNMALTSATMTPAIVAEARTVTHSYAWTNAMVVALGASLTGDITVATLPAKTRVDKALLYIDTAGAGVTTLTVSCGDAVGGTPFTNYILPSDAKAAANTLYGDLASGAETGASLFDATAKWVSNYVPSSTGTTLVTCHFISTGTNLNTVTTSTGHLVLTTTLLP